MPRNVLICLLFLSFLNVEKVHSQLPEQEAILVSKTAIDSVPVIRVHLNKYFIDRRKLRTKDAADLLSCADSSSFVMFNKGHKLQRTGGTVAIFGAGLCAVGSIVAMGEALNNLFSQTEDHGSTGIPMLIASGSITFAGLLLMTIGKSQKTRSVRLYNHKVRSSGGVASFYSRLSGNAVSVGLKF